MISYQSGNLIVAWSQISDLEILRGIHDCQRFYEKELVHITVDYEEVFSDNMGMLFRKIDHCRSTEIFCHILLTNTSKKVPHP